MSEGTELYFLFQRSCFLLFIFHSGLVLYFCIFLSACLEVEGVRQEEKEGSRWRGGRGREEESVLLQG